MTTTTKTTEDGERKMEPGDSDRTRESTRASPLEIDLNEIPTSSDPFDLVRTYHDVPDLPPEPAADPVVARGHSTCGACGEPEDGGRVVVCDGCERGFHLGCTGMRWPGDFDGEEWVCGQCRESGVKSQRWPLGFKPKKKRVFDINASPPSDADGEGDGSDELIASRKRSLGDYSFGGNQFGSSERYSNFFTGSGRGFENASALLGRTFELSFRRHGQFRLRHSEVGLGSPVENMKNDDSLLFQLPQQNPSELLLLALRDYISQRHGVLEEGWHVELKQSTGGIYAVYCSPNGITFDSMSGVASYLGLVLDRKASESRVGSQGFPFPEKFHMPRKRKSSRSSAMNGFTEAKESLLLAYSKESSSDCQGMDVAASTNGNIVKINEAGNEGNANFSSHQHHDGLPVQFEDFFLLSFGTIDLRPMYHSICQIWPVGYRSCWHDKVTGSFFFCEVSDGGDAGPAFKIRRCSCSAETIPRGSTILYMRHLLQFASGETEEASAIHCHMDLDNDENIQSIISDPFPPTENEIATCLANSSSKDSDIAANNMQSEACSIVDESGVSLNNIVEFKDEIGEIFVEEISSSLAWKKMSQRIITSLSDIQNRKFLEKLPCKHVENGRNLPNWDLTEANCSQPFSALAKFHGWPFPVPTLYSNNNDVSADVLAEWLSQDRFGLDMEFVQEMIEQLPGVDDCSSYEFLNNRSNYSTLPILGNGNFLLRKKDGAEEALDGLFRRSKRVRTDADHGRNPPPGTSVCSGMPSELVGDFYQAWEVLWRFHEILGIKELSGLKELEEELVNPWPDNESPMKMGIQGNDSSNLQEADRGGMSSSASPSALTACGENPRALLSTETTIMKESSEAKNASVRLTLCGLALTKVHSSLLDVLIGELQSKVAAIVDPNFDSGELKPKRGRKKDIDSSIPAKRTKLNMLPINELSWPELARRYVLAILAMDGNSESAEVTARESGKVFRCLQGDGGVLCGSLTGIAGMEADAVLLAEASKRIFGCLNRENGVLTVEGDETAESGATEGNTPSEPDTLDWVEALEPVKKLPTNVGTRIRKCVYDALDRNPPEWARKKLEHSISKEVYKGNASGPTKKAVLSVLADASADRVPKKPDKPKKGKTTIAVSDIIMKQCRIVLRQAAAADDSRVFCNLLGRKLVNGSDNDDEGLLGSPAMVSRPLDFRTIDLRLAVGAYGGSYEPFLEDVRELWDNVRAAFGDQADLVELADKLSQNFESLFEKEVIPVYNRLMEYKNMESLSDEVKKELNDFLSSISVLPKAPWDEGVCKVCGVDKDDDSVLLCDTCDAEYHTYCLNPPLARIPEGNWYCPSCVARRRVTLDGLEQTHLIRRHKGKRYQGEVTRDYLEALSHIASVMEEKDYWEYSVAERTFLMKFLCDELLCSALIRQHLEQFAETSLELQQKLRSFSMEWKTLKSREEFMARAAMVGTITVDKVGEVGTKEGLDPAPTSNGSVTGQKQSERANNLNLASDPQTTDKSDCSPDTDGHLKDVEIIENHNKLPENLLSDNTSQNNVTSLKMNESSTSDPASGDHIHSDKEESSLHARDMSNLVSFDEHPGSQASQVELNSLKKEICLVEDSISTLESQLFKLSLRREFLGSDSLGRLYWAALMPGQQLRFIVDGSLAVQQRGHRADFSDLLDCEGSKARCPYWYESNHVMAPCHPLVLYQSDAEIEQLVGWLKDDDLKERAVKDAILHWRKSRLQGYQHQKDNGLVGQMRSEDLAFSDHPTTKAALYLERQYGPFSELPTAYILKCEKKGKVTGEEKLYRCDCLEPVWSSRCHCFSCHKTFISETDMEAHDDGKCCSTQASHDKGKEILELLRGKEMVGKECTSEGGMVEKSRCLEVSSKLIKYQNDGLVCPYDMEEIISKFITRDSNKELVQQIGLLGSNGIPSFVPCRSPLLDDSPAMLISRDGAGLLSVEKMDTHAMFPALERRTIPDAKMVDSFKPATEKGGTKNVNRRFGRTGETEGEFPRDIVGGSCCVVPLPSLRPISGKTSQIWRRLKMNLLDMEAAVSEEAFKPSKANFERRCSWRSFVKSAQTIYEMIQATIIFEDMIKTQYLRNEWWYWSSWSAAAKTSTISSLALRLYSLDSSVLYEKNVTILDSSDSGKPDTVQDQKIETVLDTNTVEKEKPRASRKSSRRRKDPEG